MYIYDNIEEKSEYFYLGDKIINDVDYLFEVLQNEYDDEKNPFIYRGVNEAKYFLYNSSQRSYYSKGFLLENDKEVDFIQYDNFIENKMQQALVWRNGVLKKTLKAYGIEETNTLSLLSFLQHYGIPTPLIDFTKNPFVALYFAINNQEDYLNNQRSHANLLNHFVSVYKIVKPSAINNLFDGFYEFQNISLNNIPYSCLSQKSLGLCLLSDENNEYKLYNNPHIINQEGQFYFNSHPYAPLEVNYKDLASRFLKESQLHSELKKGIPDKIGYCFNIPKLKIPEIRKKLDSMGINNEFLFPKFTDINFDIK